MYPVRQFLALAFHCWQQVFCYTYFVKIQRTQAWWRAPRARARRRGGRPPSLEPSTAGRAAAARRARAPGAPPPAGTCAATRAGRRSGTAILIITQIIYF